MTKEDKEKFEQALADRGYKKITQAKAELNDDYEWYKAFRDKDCELLYQTFFCFWDFEKYRNGAGWSVSIIIMPNSIDNLGRRDLSMSVDWSTNIDKVERVAAEYYDFITKMDKI